MKSILSRQASNLVVLLILFGGAAVVIASDSFTVNYGTNSTITAFSTCKKVTNNSATGLSVYVPTQTSAEWTSFQTNPPTGVVLGSCGVPIIGWKTDTGTEDWLATGLYDLGTPQGWVNTGAVMPSTSNRAQVAVIGNTVYLFAAGSSQNAIYSAPVSNPTNWTNIGAALPAQADDAQIAVIGSYVYIFGGWNGRGVSNKIYRAPTSNPTAWVDTGATLPGPLRMSQLAVIGNNVYLFGGHTGPGATNAIYTAPVSNPLAWTNTGKTIPAALINGSVFAANGYVYYVGGADNNSNPKNTIYRALATDPTTWSNTGATIPVALYDASVAVLGNHIYIFGGMTSRGGALTNQVFSATVLNPTSWSATGSTLPLAVARTPTAIVGANIYIFGAGAASPWPSATRAIYRAPLVGQ